MPFIDQIEAIEKKMKPRFTVPVKMIPVAKNWTVGDDYELKIKVTQKILRELEDGELEVTFEINKMKEMGAN